MYAEKNKGPGDMITMKDSFNLALFLARCHVMAFLPFFRRGFGRGGVGLFGFVAFLVLLFLALEPAGFWYLVAWLMAVIYQRVSTARAWMRGEIVHSQYWGEPWLGRLFFKRDGMAKVVEGAACVVGGMLLLPFSESLGVFVMSGALSMVVIVVFDQQYLRMRLQRMHDAEIENKYMSDLYRGRMVE